MPGLANSLALEGAAVNIHCNAIAPTALSRMVSGFLPRQDMSVFSIDPMDVAQLAVWLCALVTLDALVLPGAWLQ